MGIGIDHWSSEILQSEREESFIHKILTSIINITIMSIRLSKDVGLVLYQVKTCHIFENLLLYFL